jgi:POT family proton-dependent oligopeptide transporter
MATDEAAPREGGEEIKAVYKAPTTGLPDTPPPDPPARMPRQIGFIIGNEVCERFSFYGMRNVLMIFLIDYLLREVSPDQQVRSDLAKERFHLFVAGVYFFPLLGGFLADRWLGKYKTILYLSLVYCAGHACLALFDDDARGFYAGLGLIALGSGGIKPCVSAMVGDQFTYKNKHLVKVVFNWFYFSINFGSFFASLLIPITLRKWGPAVAFGIPGALMFVATVIFWLGRDLYAHVPPTGHNPHSFFRVIGSAIASPRKGTFLSGAEASHPAEAVEGARAVLRIVLLFSPIPVFWMLFDQKASTWVVQARSMDPKVGPFTFEPAQMQLINPALVMVLIPFTAGVVYPAFKRLGYELTPLRRMTIGLFLGASSYVVAGLLNVPVAAGERITILWQIAPYILLTTAEILVSTTGLEFAYSQAPLSMKGTIMSFWNLTVTIANLTVAQIAALKLFSGTPNFFFYAALCLAGGVVFGLLAWWYKPVDHFRKDGPSPAGAGPAPAPAARPA